MGMLTYTWNFGDGSTPLVIEQPAGMATIDHAYPSLGNYSATLTVSNKAGQMTASTVVTLAPPFTVTSQSFVVWGLQTGYYTGTYASTQEASQFDSAPDFKPGEIIRVNLTPDIRAATDDVSLIPYAWQFRTAAAGSNATFVSSSQTFTASSEGAVKLGDFNNDGYVDVVIGDEANDATLIMINDGTGAFTTSESLTGLAREIKLGDLNRDGDLDGVATNQQYGLATPHQVWLNDGDGTLTSVQELGHAIGDLSLLDLNHDGHLDILLNGGWLNDGNGAFTSDLERRGRALCRPERGWVCRQPARV